MSRFQYIQRIFWPSIDSRAKLDRAKDMLTRHRAACDGVSIFCEGDCMDSRYQSPEESKRRAEWMRVIIAEFKELGFDTQINILNTLGHGDTVEVFEGDVCYPTMVGHTGVKNVTTACPRSEEFLEYVRGKYRAFAECGPRVIWVDDDLRMQHHPPIDYGCFCDDCMRTFSGIVGRTLSREELVWALCKGDPSDGEALREAFLRFNQEALIRVLRTAAAAAHEVDPDIIMGYMTTGAQWNLYNVPDYAACGDAIRNHKGEVYFRPGGGCWNDRVPLETISKSLAIARQIAWSIHDASFYSELEAMPYMILTKSPAMTAFEIAAHIGIGGTHGTMLDLMDCMGNDWSEQETYLRAMAEARPFLSALSDAIAGHASVGFYPYLSPMQWKYGGAVENLNELRDMGAGRAEALFYLGVPLSYRDEGALGSIVSGGAMKAMTADEVRARAARPLYLDAEAAADFMQVLGDEALGVRVREIPKGNTYERFTDHPLNGRYAGDVRDANPMYTTGRNCGLEVCGADVLTELYDYNHRPLGLAGMAADGHNGRAVVCAFGAWCDLMSLRKREQVLEACAWLNGGSLPVRLTGPYAIVQAVWDGAEDRVVALFNAGFEPAKRVEVKSDRGGLIEALSPDGTWSAMGEGNGCEIADFAPWSVRVLRIRGLKS